MPKPAVLLFLLTAGSAGVAAENSTGLVPTEDFARAPLYSQVQISPDGQTLAFLREFEGKPVLAFADLTTLKAKGVNAGTVPWRGAPQQVTSFQWIGDRRVVYSASFWDQFFGGVSAIDCDCRNLKPLSGIDATAPSDDGLRDLKGYSVKVVRVARRYPLRARTTIYHFDDKDQSILMLDRGDGYGEDVLFPNVVKVFTLTGGYRTMVSNPGDVVAWGVDYSGVVRWGMTRDGEKRGLIYRASAADPWRIVPKTAEARGTIRPLCFDVSNQKLYVAALSPKGRWAVYRFDPMTGELGDLILDDPNYDLVPELSVPSPFFHTMVSPLKHRLLGVFYVTDGPRYKWLDPELIRYQGLIDDHSPKTVNLIVGSTRDERRFLVFSFSDKDPGSYYIFDAGRLTIGRVVSRMPWIKPELMAGMYPIQYPSRDGRAIHGYMTLPKGQAPKKLPLVVMPHGGPWVRDVWSFDPLVQMLANRGYAVLQMNYRGSPGYGAEFSRIAKHEIGRGIQDDIEDGARWAIARGIADPSRMAIVGTSYGGYSTLFALAHSPGLYRCGISVAGVTDWVSLIDSKTGGQYKFAHEHWVQEVGDPKNDHEFLESISPINFADKITEPLLIIQGKEDRTVPPKQASSMIAVLEKDGRPPESLLVSGEGHGFTAEKSRIELYKRIEEFLARNMGPGQGKSFSANP